LKNEVDVFLAQYSEERLEDGRARVVRHGSGPERAIQTGIGPIPIAHPKVRDRAPDDAGAERIRFSSTRARKGRELIGFQAGVSESAQSWRELLVNLKARGLSIAQELAVGDGALGFWKALDEVFRGTRHQRCWFHKIGNVVNKSP